MELNRDTINKIRGLILFTVITVIVGINYIKVLGLLAAAVNMAAPFILGAAIAFVLNVPMRRIESSLSHVLKKGSRLLRPVSMALSILLVAGVLFLVMFGSGSPAGAHTIRPSKQYPRIFRRSPSVA